MMSFTRLTPGTPQYEASPVQRHLSGRSIPGSWYRLESDLNRTFRVFPDSDNVQFAATVMVKLVGALQGGPFQSIRFRQAGSDQCIEVIAA